MSAIRKGQFAELCGVSAARVSQWISEGKIDGAAIVGEGRMAMIDPDRARAQLRTRLAINERFGENGLSTKLGPDSDDEDEGDGSVEARIKAQKLRHAQLLTSRLEEEDRRRRGVYIEAAGARGEMSRLASDLLSAVEGALPDLASDLSAKFEISARDAVHCLRAGFRRFRERTAARYAAVAASAPPTKPTGEDEPGGIQ